MPLVVPVAVLAALGIAFAVCRKLEVDCVPAFAWLACAALAMGCMAETALLAAGDAAAEALASHPVSSCTFVVASPQVEGTYGLRCRARASVDGRPAGEVWLACSQELLPGDVVRGVGRFAPCGADDWGRQNRARGICGSVSMSYVYSHEVGAGPLAWLAQLRTRALGWVAPGESAERALLAALACGERSHLAQFGLDTAFATCGLSHLVAISGAHVSLASMLLASALERTRMRPKVRMVVLALATLALVVFCGSPVSALRAWLMSLVAFGSAVVGRRGHGLSSVCAVACAMALACPAWMGELGFRLSVASVVGPCLFGGCANYALRALLPGIPWPDGTPKEVRRNARHALSGARAATSATIVAQFATLPLTIPLFSRLALVAPLANALVAVPFQACVGLGLMAVALGWVPVLGPVIILGFDLVACVLLALVRACAGLPMASIAVSSDGHVEALVVLCAAIALLIAWPEVRRDVLAPAAAALVTLALCLLLRWRLLEPARVVVLDVGQGDAILIQDGPHAVLVDTGPDDALVHALARQHVFHLDAVVITHQHDDHYGGLDEIVGAVGVDEVIVAQGVAGELVEEVATATETLTGGEPMEVTLGDVIHVGGFELRVVWPLEEVDGHENEDSIELLLTYGAGNAQLTGLLTGDGEQNELAGILEAGAVGDIDLLKGGHHGSEVSLTAGQAGALSPELSVASAGAGNSYGHPADACVEVLEGAGSAFLCTMDVGDVEIRPGAEGMRVATYGVRVSEWLESAV